MKKLFPFLALLILAGCQPVVKGQWVNSVPTIDDLLWLNAYDTHSNVVAVCGTTKGDNLGGLFSFYRGAVDPTNDMVHFGPFESLNPASPAGRWICTIQGANTGGTNIFNYLIVTNLTVINNLVTTNFFITNITSITTNSITFFTNVYITNANIYLNGTNIPAINPTMGYVPYNQDGTNFGDSPIYVLNTNTIQVYEVDANDVLVTNLQTGGVVISLLSGEVTNLFNGTGALTNDGVGNLGWFDVSGANLWTNSAGVLQPKDLTLQPMVPSLAVGTNTLGLYGPLSLGEVLVSVRPDTEISGYTEPLWLERRATDGTKSWIQGELDNWYSNFYVTSRETNSSKTQITLATGTNDTGYISIYVSDHAGGSTPRFIANPTESGAGNTPYIADTTLAHTSGNLWEHRNNGTNLLSVLYNGGLGFGPGTTNVLYRDDLYPEYLTWTNSGIASGVGYRVANGAGNVATFGTDAGGNAILSADSGHVSKLSSDNGSALYFAGTAPYGFYPSSTNLTLGEIGAPWGSFSTVGTGYFYGHISGPGLVNYSRLAVSMPSGTNGPIDFDSQSAGTAGLPRPISYDFGGTNHFQFLYENGGSLLPLFKVVNASDYVGFSLLGGTVPHLVSSAPVYMDQALGTKNIIPESDNTYDIGNSSGSGAYKDLYQKGVHYVEGMNDGAGNYSWLAARSTGTNSWDTHKFDSQAAGTAGTPRPIMFTNQPTVIIAGTTNFITFGATNAAPVDAVNIFKWVSVSINGEATEYRIPLYK